MHTFLSLCFPFLRHLKKRLPPLILAAARRASLAARRAAAARPLPQGDNCPAYSHGVKGLGFGAHPPSFLLFSTSEQDRSPLQAALQPSTPELPLDSLPASDPIAGHRAAPGGRPHLLAGGVHKEGAAGWRVPCVDPQGR